MTFLTSLTSLTSTTTTFKNRLNRHLRENNQTYFQHLKDAWSYAGQSGLATLGFFVHGVFPFTFEHTGSGIIRKVDHSIKEKMKNVSVVNDE